MSTLAAVALIVGGGMILAGLVLIWIIEREARQWPSMRNCKTAGCLNVTDDPSGFCWLCFIGEIEARKQRGAS